MKAKDLIEYLQTFPPDAEVVTARWDSKVGRTILHDAHPACNEEHQRERNQVMIIGLEGTMRYQEATKEASLPPR